MRLAPGNAKSSVPHPSHSRSSCSFTFWPFAATSLKASCGLLLPALNTPRRLKTARLRKPMLSVWLPPRDSPASARGWYLLGRLYGGQNQWQNARDAYAKSQQLKADEGAELGYIESLWQLNGQQYNEEIRQLLLAMVKRNPVQGDALSMLAMDAYQRKDYQQAILYWRRLLPMVPAESEEGKALRKAIAKAQEMSGKDAR